jgi:hypothetical protein
MADWRLGLDSTQLDRGAGSPRQSSGGAARRLRSRKVVLRWESAEVAQYRPPEPGVRHESVWGRRAAGHVGSSRPSHPMLRDRARHACQDRGRLTLAALHAAVNAYVGS